MYTLSQKIGSSSKQNNEFEKWDIINFAKNTGEKILLKGLPTNDDIQSVDKVDIDITKNDDGSISLDPRLLNLSKKIQSQYEDRLQQDDRDGVVITERTLTGASRLIVQKKVMEAFKKVKKHKKISKEDSSKFLQNPGSFLFDDEESEKDVAINIESYRIIGIGEPYIGYFGSIKLNSPIAEAISKTDNNSHSHITKAKLEFAIDGKKMEDIGILQKSFIDANTTHQENMAIDGTNFKRSEFPQVINELEKYLPKTDNTKNTDNLLKGVLKILPNDEFEILVEDDTYSRKPLDQIMTNCQTEVPLISNIKYPPKTYQTEGINWLIDLYENNYRGCILADDMGLGKTYQIIAFLNYIFNYKKIDGRVLIVTPTILLDNWKNEIHKFVINQSKFRVKILIGADLCYRSKLKSNDNLSYNYFDPSLLLEVENFPTVVITTYQTLANYQWSFVEQTKFNFECIVYDEAHSIKNPKSQISQAARGISSQVNFNILLSGTPIENELRDLWALFDVFDPSHFGSWKKFKKEYVNTKNENLDENLRNKASAYILRRLKKDYLHELPKKEDKTHSVMFTANDENEYMEIVNSDYPALSRLHRLKAFSFHKFLVNQQNGNTSIDKNDFERFAKAQKLLEVLNEIKLKNEKVIIFAINRFGQDVLKFGLSNHFGLKVEIINGDNNDQASVKKKLDYFKSTDGFGIMILSPLAAGVGLTIVEANHVIHYERWWNPSKEDQASDRVYRIGQNKNVFIHYIVGKLPAGKKSIDEAIHELIEIKRKTAGFLIPAKSITDTEIAQEIIDSKLSISQKIDLINWEAFEILIKTIYEAMGYLCELTPSGWQAEHGADIIATKNNEVIAIQCKHSQTGSSKGKEAIYQLCTEAKEFYQTNNLVAVTNSFFDNGARILAEKNNIKLIQKDELIELIKTYQPIDF